MQSHRFFAKPVPDHVEVGRGSTLPALIFSLAAFLFASQAISQTRLNREIEAPLVSATTPISAPIPALEEADLAAPPISFSALEASQAGNQSSSESSSQSVPAPTKPTATKPKPQHHGLGVALAVVGTAALVSGVALFAAEQSIGVCNGSSHGCNEAKDAGLVLMPVGAGVAVTGFYFQFHR